MSRKSTHGRKAVQVFLFNHGKWVPESTEALPDEFYMHCRGTYARARLLNCSANENQSGIPWEEYGRDPHTYMRIYSFVYRYLYLTLHHLLNYIYIYACHSISVAMYT